MAGRAGREMTVEEFDAWCAAGKKVEAARAAAGEEGGPALRRLQSNLSGRSQPPVEHKRRRSLLRSIGKSIRRKRVPTTLREEDDDEVTPVASKS